MGDVRGFWTRTECESGRRGSRRQDPRNGKGHLFDMMCTQRLKDLTVEVTVGAVTVEGTGLRGTQSLVNLLVTTKTVVRTFPP